IVHAWTADDGWVLRVYEFSPRDQPVRGIVVLGHAMMVDAQTLCRADRATVAATFVGRGFRVLVPDLRGHGESGPRAAEGGSWSYDDHVRDVGLFVRWARRLAPDAPLHLVGHSLFGNASLAWLGQNPKAEVSSVVLLCVDIWCRKHEPRWWRWLFKRAFFLCSLAVVKMVGYLPAIRLGVGSADESARYWAQFDRWMRDDAWTDEQGAVDYGDGLAMISQPVLHVMGQGDLLYAVPEASLAFTEAIVRREVMRVPARLPAHAGGAGAQVGHMTLVTDPQCAPVWERIARWLDSRASPGSVREAP
ncbi:MAG: alpha/beta fold hydrolase, partial [Nannocystaceae bacterium]